MSEEKKTERKKSVKPQYEPPVLKKHGSVAEITQAKAGNKADGMGKPNTRLSGTNQ